MFQPAIFRMFSWQASFTICRNLKNAHGLTGKFLNGWSRERHRQRAERSSRRRHAGDEFQRLRRFRNAATESRPQPEFAEPNSKRPRNGSTSRLFTTAPQFTIGTSFAKSGARARLPQFRSRNHQTHDFTETTNLEFRTEIFNLTNTPPLSKSEHFVRFSRLRHDHDRRRPARDSVRIEIEFLNSQKNTSNFDANLRCEY